MPGLVNRQNTEITVEIAGEKSGSLTFLDLSMPQRDKVVVTRSLTRQFAIRGEGIAVCAS